MTMRMPLCTASIERGGQARCTGRRRARVVVTGLDAAANAACASADALAEFGVTEGVATAAADGAASAAARQEEMVEPVAVSAVEVCGDVMLNLRGVFERGLLAAQQLQAALLQGDEFVSRFQGALPRPCQRDRDGSDQTART